jgi:hypothetical protein
MMSDLSLGGAPGNPANIADDMNAYQAQKQKLKAAEQAGDDAAAEVARANMAYWEQKCIADGAMSIDVCSVPSQFIWDSWRPDQREDYLDKRKRAAAMVARMEAHGLPEPN